MRNPALVLATILAVSGCSLVELTPAGDNVAVLQLSEVGNCTKTGATTVSVLDRVIARGAIDAFHSRATQNTG